MLEDGATSKLKMNPNDSCAIYNHPSYGPKFGSGFDFQVQGECLYLKTGYTYQSVQNQLKGSHSFTIKEMEVFQVTWQSSSKECTRPNPKKLVTKHAMKTSDIHKSDHDSPSKGKVQCLTHAIYPAINKKWVILAEVELEIASLEANFTDEVKFITFFSTGSGQDIISFNVCGTNMTTTRQTLEIFKDSVLASKILNARQEESSTNKKPIQEWNTEDVVAWLNKIDGLSNETIKNFQKDEVTGLELHSLGKKGAQGQSVVFIEHAPYCFEKNIDHLRLKSMIVNGIVDQEPEAPIVRASEKSRFEKIVKHYFSMENSKVFLGN
ncbi:hypothetical protein ACHAW6_001468 [Cyclotella cf. meneghiniana]